MTHKEWWTNVAIVWENILKWKDQFLETKTLIMPWKTTTRAIATIIGIIIGIKVLWKIIEKWFID